PGLEREREAEQRAMTIELRQLFATANDQRGALDPREQCRERRRHLENDLGAPGCNEWRVSNELDGIAEPLLGVEQDCLSFERLIAEPERLRKIPPPRREILHPPTPLEFLAASIEIAQQEPKTASVRMRFSIVRVDRQRPVVACERLERAIEVSKYN